MNAIKISDVEAFKRESDKARNIPLSKEDIKRINEIAREAELEENEYDESNLPLTAKDTDESSSVNF
ncbi:MAG: hypothetical protein Q7U04_01395 [Bacteriovorax sp.]|nr:hypothetical protein [Bacteriovorax sp.]